MNNLKPHILYWKWFSNDILKDGIMEAKTEDIINRSIFDYIYISLHGMKNIEDNRELIKQKLTCCTKKFSEAGRKVFFDFTWEVTENKKECEITFVYPFRGTFDGMGQADISKKADGIFKLISCSFNSDGEFFNPVNIEEFKFSKGRLETDSRYKNTDFICLFTCKEQSNYDPSALDAYSIQKEYFDAVKDIPLCGIAADEWKIPVVLKIENVTDKSITDIASDDEMDINKVNFVCDGFWYSEGLASVYEKYSHSGLYSDFIYLFYNKKDCFDKNISVINNYIKSIKEITVRTDRYNYELTKEYFGEDAFFGVHATWWGDETDNNFDAVGNGLDWWSIKRDYSQTDEMLPIPARLAISRKCPENIWYNMWYSMRTMDIRTYYKETLVNARFGGRTHYLGYECNEPGIVLPLCDGDYLDKIKELELKIEELNHYQYSRPDSKVLVIFGYEACTNWKLSNPYALSVERCGGNMSDVLRFAKELHEKLFLSELVPSYEIDEGFVEVDGRGISYCGHYYDVCVLIHPEALSKKAYDLLQGYSEGGKLIVIGDINYFSDGSTCKKQFDNAVLSLNNANISVIINILNELNIKPMMGKNYCIFEDGSVVVTAIGDNNINNGVFCGEFNVSDETSDIAVIKEKEIRFI